MKQLFSIVVPLFNEQDNLPGLFERLRAVEQGHEHLNFEYIFVDDASEDSTCEVALQLSKTADNVRVIKLTPNAGAHEAIMVGVKASRGDVVLFIAGDLQDPPELISDMLKVWQTGRKIVWAARTRFAGQKTNSRSFSQMYWFLNQYVCGYNLPGGGVDFTLLDRVAVDEIAKKWNGSYASVFDVIAESDYSSCVLYYNKLPRRAGKSGWTLRKKLSLVLKTAGYGSKAARVLHKLFFPEPAFKAEELQVPEKATEKAAR